MFSKVNVVLIKWLFGFGIVGYLLITQDFSQFKEAILRTNLRYLAAGAVFVLIARLFYALQTAIAVRHHGIQLTTLRALVINTISQFYSLFIPGEIGGGVIKWYKLSKPSGKRTEIFAAILFLKLINTSLFLAFGIFGLLVENPFNSALLFWIVSLFLFASVVLLIIFFSERTIFWLERILKLHSFWIPSFVVNGLRKVIFSCAVYRRIPFTKLCKVLSVPFLNHICRMIIFFFIAKSLNLWIPLFALIWIPSIVYLIQIIPVTISGLGFREGALAYLLSFYGINPVGAIAFSLIIFGFTVLAGLIGGILEGTEVLIGPFYRFFRIKSAANK